MNGVEEQTWTNRTAFVMAAIGSAVGLGNLWRFPYVAYENGGGAFLIPWLVALFTAGVPLMILEFTLGYHYHGGAPAAFERMRRGTSWIGWGAMLNGFIIVCYYAVVMAWALCYLWYCPKVAWKGQEGDFFLHNILQLSEGPGTLGGFNWPVLIGLVLTWVLIYLIIYKGPQVVSKVVMLTVPLPALLILVFVVRGLTLPGAMEGLRFYLTPDFSKLTDISVWRAAYGQIFFSLSLAFGIMIAYARYQRSSEVDLNTSAAYTSIANCSLSFIAGFAVFTVVGYLGTVAHTTIDHLSISGPGLAFITYPTALALMPAAPLLGALFFIMLLTLGIDSAFSLVEAVATGISDYLCVSKSRAALTVCLAGLGCGLVFATRAGLHWLDIVDHFANDILLVLFGLLECVAAGWLIGTGRLRELANRYSSRAVDKWWDVCLAGLTPVVLAVLLFQAVYTSVSEPYGGYPQWALIVGGWGLAATVVALSLILGRVCTAKPLNFDPDDEARLGPRAPDTKA